MVAWEAFLRPVFSVFGDNSVGERISKIAFYSLMFREFFFFFELVLMKPKVELFGGTSVQNIILNGFEVTLHVFRKSSKHHLGTRSCSPHPGTGRAGT